MAELDDLLKALPLDQIAGQLGIDQGTAQSAASGLLPAIFGGLQANAQDPAGAESLGKAVSQHSPALVEGGINLDDVDTEDGAKIAGHIFGPQQDQVVAKVAETTGTEPSVLSKLLPALAPIALSYISKKMQSSQAGAAGQGEPQAAGGLGGILGSLLGGGGSGGGGMDIGSILGGLGGLLGGGRR
jgi:hypothetical protein